MIKLHKPGTTIKQKESINTYLTSSIMYKDITDELELKYTGKMAKMLYKSCRLNELAILTRNYTDRETSDTKDATYTFQDKVTGEIYINIMFNGSAKLFDLDKVYNKITDFNFLKAAKILGEYNNSPITSFKAEKTSKSKLVFINGDKILIKDLKRFATSTFYNEILAQSQGYESYSEKLNILAQSQGYESYSEKQNISARREGFLNSTHKENSKMYRAIKYINPKCCNSDHSHGFECYSANSSRDKAAKDLMDWLAKETKEFSTIEDFRYEKYDVYNKGIRAINLLETDHVDGNPSNCNEANLQVFCADCHKTKTWLAGDGNSAGRGTLKLTSADYKIVWGA